MDSTTPSTTAFDDTLPGYLDYDNPYFDHSVSPAVERYPLTSAGETALEQHYELINDALQAWAREHGVTVELTDHVHVTAPDGIEQTAGGDDNLSESPAAWVAFAQETLDDIALIREERVFDAALAASDL